MLVLFVISIFVLTGITAIVVDVSWYWANSLRVQRAADAAALAGVVWLPGDPSTAYGVARDEASKNGYDDTGGGITVTPVQDATNKRRLNVTISAPINTYFMRIFGIPTINATRTSKAEYVLPVPMGSPQNYYGVGFLRDALSTTKTTSGPQDDTGWDDAANALSGSWNQADNADDNNDNRYATSSTNNATQLWGNFALLGTNGIPSSAVIDGLEVRLRAGLTGSNGTTTNCRLSIDTTWNGNVGSPTWSTTQQLTLTTSETQTTFGSQTSTTAWGGHAWIRGDFADNLFRVRITNLRGAGCNRTAAVDTLEVRVTFHTVATTTSTDLEDVDMIGPQGQPLAPQNFWGAMQSQGAPNIQGDAYMTRYESRSGFPPNNLDNTDPDAQYLPDAYYNYAIDMPAGSSGGSVWVFDPGFCDSTTSAGTGENWTVGGSNGYSSRQPVSAFYDLYNTKNTLYDSTDDGPPIASSGSTFRRLSYEDRTIFSAAGQNTTSGIADCSNLSWHYDAQNWRSGSPSNPRRGWYQLASGLTGGANGTTYRLHTSSTDPGSPNDQNNTTALNAFAIYASASGGTPRVYGIGAMEAYVRLPAGRSTEFYLAQIDAVHAGKTMVINLWDPGDTGQLSARLEILQPGATDYTPVAFNYHATRGTSDGAASSCSSATVTGATSITTNTGGNSLYNGCWLTIEVQLPPTYSAPHPSTDSTTSERGWWKIRYTMGTGSASDYSTDLTTWQVDIRGNPVHLIVP